MKKLFLSLCVMMLSVGAFAQKGTSAVGLNLNATPLVEKGVSLTNFGVAAKYQYNITNPLRVEAVVGYDFEAKGMSLFEAGVNVNWLFNVGSKFKIYPIAGVGYANIKGTASIEDGNDVDDLSASVSKFYYNLGAGVEYSISQHFAVSVEGKYQGIKWFNRVPVTVGFAYKF